MAARASGVAAGPRPAIQIGTVAEVVRAHEVSILMAMGIAVGLFRGGSPAVNTSMMRMAEPQHGHGLVGVVATRSAPRAALSRASGFVR